MKKQSLLKINKDRSDLFITTPPLCVKHSPMKGAVISYRKPWQERRFRFFLLFLQSSLQRKFSHSAGRTSFAGISKIRQVQKTEFPNIVAHEPESNLLTISLAPYLNGSIPKELQVLPSCALRIRAKTFSLNVEYRFYQFECQHVLLLQHLKYEYKMISFVSIFKFNFVGSEMVRLFYCQLQHNDLIWAV